MAISFKVSKKGTRFRPKPKPQSPSSVVEDNDKVDVLPQLPKTQPPSNRKRSVDDTDDDGDVAGIFDAQVSFILNIFPDGYTIKNPSEGNIDQQNAVQNDPKLLCPYDRTSESLFAAIECGRVPADFLDDIPFKYSNGAVVCEVRDYRNEQGVNCLSTVASPSITKVSLQMSLNNVLNDIDQISDSSLTYGDLLEAESRILKALKPTLFLDPIPNLNRLCKEPTFLNLNLNIPGIRRKKIRQMYEAVTVTVSDNQIQLEPDKVPEKSNLISQQEPDVVYLGTRNVGQSNMINTGPENSDDVSLIMSFVHGKKGTVNNKKRAVNNKKGKGRSNHTKIPVISGVVGSHMSGQLTPIGEEIDERIIKGFSRIQMWTERSKLNRKKYKIDVYKKTTNFPKQHLAHFLRDKDETSVVGGNIDMNICMTDHVSQGSGVPKLRNGFMLSEKERYYGELAKEEVLPTLPNTPKQMNMVESSGGQPNSSGVVLLVNGEIHQIMGQSMSEIGSGSGTHNMPSGRMHPTTHGNSSQSSVYQQQQQLHMIASNHLNSDIQQLGNYMVLQQQLQILQQQQEAQNYSKMMMMVEMGMLTAAQAAAIMADRMVQQSKTNVTEGQFGNNIFSGHSMVGYGMDPMQTNVNPYIQQQLQSFYFPPQQVGLPSPSIGMPHQQSQSLYFPPQQVGLPSPSIVMPHQQPANRDEPSDKFWWSKLG